MRVEFGLQRTTCSCKQCSVWCEHVPGFLVPSDLERLIPSGHDPFVWAEEHLLASPGYQIISPSFTLSIPSLVPKRQSNGHCHWLEEGRCTVHEDSPYGCAFLCQCTQTKKQAERISNLGREARARSFRENDLYAQIWHHLWKKGCYEMTTKRQQKQALVAIGRISRAEKRKERHKAKKDARKRRK